MWFDMDNTNDCLAETDRFGFETRRWIKYASYPLCQISRVRLRELVVVIPMT